MTLKIYFLTVELTSGNTVSLARFSRKEVAPPAYCGDFSMRISEDEAMGRLKPT